MMASTSTAPVLLRSGVDATGAPLELLLDPHAETIIDAAPTLTRRDGDVLVDCAGMVLLAAPAEPHAHLDKALSVSRAPNPAGDLSGALAAWSGYAPSLSEEEILGRARRAAHELIAHGTTAIRSHADVSPATGIRAVRALVRLREELRTQRLAAVQVVAMALSPVTGSAEAAALGVLDAAMLAGADAIGGAPHLDPDPAAATRSVFTAAERFARPIDLHCDETLDPTRQTFAELVRLVKRTGFGHGAVAGHCVALGMMAAERQRHLAAEAASSGVAVVTLPQTNLYLQARGIDVAAPRGLTAVRRLLDAGVCVAAGGDNVRDPFNPLGRSDALETAALLVVTAHVTPAEAWAAVSRDARRAMGLASGGLQPGAPGEVLAIRGDSLDDAMARGSEHRVVVHRGRVVADTRVTTTLYAGA